MVKPAELMTQQPDKLVRASSTMKLFIADHLAVFSMKVFHDETFTPTPNRSGLGAVENDVVGAENDIGYENDVGDVGNDVGGDENDVGDENYEGRGTENVKDNENIDD
uniref:Uncharacterized protein n=1 Tax=Tanacetum cinerariifolium TaxID=118510 RepID=A0A6L2KW29_TANCI|nr:hypothetical protein [Tanacetum cinerariifolium]